MTEPQISEAIEALKAHGYLTILVNSVEDWSVGIISKSLPPGVYIHADSATIRRVADDLLSMPGKG